MQKEIISTLPAFIQSLYSNGNLYWSGSSTMQGKERRNLILSDIESIRHQLDTLKKSLEE